MDYIIKPLTPQLAETFADYFSNMEFQHAKHWSSCFCRFYYTNCPYEQWQEKTGAENRKEAIEQIKQGNMNGYLVFDGDKCIGWCNAADARKFARLEEDINTLIKDRKVGCVICFVIHPQYRRQGVARLLLKRAIDDFREHCYDAVLALPIDRKDNPEKLYRGTLNMYRESGFKEIEKQDNVSVMWLDL